MARGQARGQGRRHRTSRCSFHRCCLLAGDHDECLRFRSRTTAHMRALPHQHFTLPHGLAVAAASTRPVGVDIEVHERRWPLNVLELITHVTEHLPRSVRLLPAMAWSCAEAVLKQRGCGIRRGIDVVHLTRFTDEGVFEWTEHPPREGRGVDAPLCGFAKNLGSHSLALVWEQEPIKQHNDERAKS